MRFFDLLWTFLNQESHPLPHPEGDHPRKRSIMGFLENPHRYWTSCIDESEIRTKPSQKQKSRRRALKCSTIDFRGTHVVCIGVPPKSRQNAIFFDLLWTFLNQDGRTWVVPIQKTPKIWQGDRNSWECIQRFIGRGIGTHGNAV